jgi:hypothetical protein
LIWFSVLVLMASFVYVSGVFEEINPRKQKLVQYALDVDRFNLICRKTLSVMGFVM